MVGQAGRRVYGALMVVLAFGAAGVLVKAAGLTTKYDAEMARLRGQWRAAQQAEGLDPGRNRKGLYGKYPTPEVTLARPVVVAPGASAPIALTGKFPAGTTFLIDHDQVTLTPGASAPGSFKATAAVDGAANPGIARLFAYAPVSGAWIRCGAVVIGATPTFELSASNGWRIVLKPAGTTWAVDRDSASAAYQIEYFKADASTPFEKLTGSLTLSAGSAPGGTYTFSTNPVATGSAMEEYQTLIAKMSDPSALLKMSARERAAFEKKMEELGDRMTKEMEAMSANVAASLEKQAQFGCGSIYLDLNGAEARGNVSCGEKVGSLTLKGSRK